MRTRDLEQTASAVACVFHCAQHKWTILALRSLACEKKVSEDAAATSINNIHLLILGGSMISMLVVTE